MTIRTFYAVFLLLIALITGAFFVIGCDRKQRHELLEFFVDGVPPLGGWDPNDPNNPDYRNNLRANSDNAARKQLHVPGSFHKPQKPCEFCHGKKTQGKYTLPIHLIEKIPDLCYNCHKDYAKTNAHVHGPVAVGKCRLCHEPHRSKNRHLLIKPVPELCFTCHNSDMINQIPSHRPELMGKCNFCHHAHAGPKKGLLRMNSKSDTRLDFKFNN
ncbi:MAG: cytochrome c3 family protein [Phycisphaerae bacterium]|nr:cytochrome c3 family protein [Phycisphaerae bacterium]